MSKIILASNSFQRKKLLEQLGLAFKVHPSPIQEDKVIKTSCAALVKHNALIKAQDTARRYKSGIVIGADTVIFLGGKKILGKPKDLKEAAGQIKRLIKKPQWVYSGVTVIDIAKKKTIVDYERTKVFMLPLKDAEIKAYHKKVSPLDKAGSFDIEGIGSVFIHRVEGCYTNVIGLPISKLFTMLKQVGFSYLK